VHLCRLEKYGEEALAENQPRAEEAAQVQRLELVIVQLEEVERLIGIGRVPHLRLAHILLDSAAELIMHRMAKSELDHERYHFDQLENLRRLDAAGRGGAWCSDEIRRLEGIVVSKTRRKKIDNNFGDKIDFLVERGRLPADLGPVLKKLHEYRNETYHRDQHRVEVIRSAVLIYFDAACTVLEHYEPGTMIHSNSLGPELRRLYEDLPRPRDLFKLPHLAAARLREEVGLDIDTVRSALRDHLLSRLADLEDGLAYVQENLTSTDVMPGDAIRVMQIQDGDLDAIFDSEVLRSRPYPLTMSDIATWTARATALDNLADKHALFTEFGAIEDCFEELEQKVRKAVWDIDEQANMR